MPYQAGPMRCGSYRAECPGLLFGSRVRAAWSVPEGPPLDIWLLSSQPGVVGSSLALVPVSSRLAVVGVGCV
jgi:hypothetical protein